MIGILFILLALELVLAFAIGGSWRHSSRDRLVETYFLSRSSRRKK